MERQGTTDAEEVEKAQRRLQGIIAGLSTNEDGEDATLANQLLSESSGTTNNKLELRKCDS